MLRATADRRPMQVRTTSTSINRNWPSTSLACQTFVISRQCDPKGADPLTGCAVSPPLYTSRHSPQSVAACLSNAAGRILSPWAPNHARPFTAARPGRRQSGKEARREADRIGRRRLEQADAWLSWSGAAIADAGRRAQCRVRLSRSELPWLRIGNRIIQSANLHDAARPRMSA